MNARTHPSSLMTVTPSARTAAKYSATATRCGITTHAVPATSVPSRTARSVFGDADGPDQDQTTGNPESPYWPLVATLGDLDPLAGTATPPLLRSLFPQVKGGANDRFCGDTDHRVWAQKITPHRSGWGKWGLAAGSGMDHRPARRAHSLDKKIK